MKAKALNFDEIYGKHLKVTDNNGDPSKPGFSLVTPLNGDSWNWRERPEFKDLVKQKLNDPGFLGDHKYQQIIDAMSGKQFDPTKHIAKKKQNMKSFIQFLKEGVIDKPLKFYEGPHPHETFNNYNNELTRLTSKPQTAESNSYPHFGSTHRYLDPKTGIETSIDVTHRNPNYIGNDVSGAGKAKVSIGWDPDPTNPRSLLQFGDVGRNSKYFNTQTQATAKINVGREHVNDLIQKMTPLGLNTINYSTLDSRRHAVYQRIAKQYPHLKFENTENTIPTHRMPKTGSGISTGLAGVGAAALGGVVSGALGAGTNAAAAAYQHRTTDEKMHMEKSMQSDMGLMWDKVPGESGELQGNPAGFKAAKDREKKTGVPYPTYHDWSN